MIVKEIRDEDFTSYKKPSMMIAFPSCTFKCERESGCNMCQNKELANAPNKIVTYDYIINRYINNPITSSFVFAGLEPFDSYSDMCSLIQNIRMFTSDDIVIFTGYYKTEIKDKIELLKQFSNIIIKFGRYIPNQQPHYDLILGVKLASDNQYAEVIS